MNTISKEAVLEMLCLQKVEYRELFKALEERIKKLEAKE